MMNFSEIKNGFLLRWPFVYANDDFHIVFYIARDGYAFVKKCCYDT